MNFSEIVVAASVLVAAMPVPAQADQVAFVVASQEGGDSIEWDVLTGKLPAFVFSGTDISDASAKFICSKKRGAVWAIVSGRTYQVNDASAEVGINVGIDGNELDAIRLTDAANFLAATPDVATRIVGQASRVCDIPAMAQTAAPATKGSARYQDGRTVYATVEAANEYCPGIERQWGVLSTIKSVYGYAPPTTDAELMALNAEKQKVFSALRSAGRAAGCEYIMDQFGPGGAPELFQFK